MKQPIDLMEHSAARREIERVFAAQRANRWKMAHTTVRERTERLDRLRKALEARGGELAQAIHADFRKPAREVELTELLPTLSEIAHTVRHLGRWMRPQRVPTPMTLTGTRSEIRYEPRGVVLILAPWNYPFQLLICPLVAAIAAGNCVVLKPSEKTPATSAFLKKLVTDVFPEDEVAIFEGDAKVAEALLDQPFDHIFFTGSTAIGHKVMEAAAKHLASVTLELGGKSPAIVDSDVDLDTATERIVWGKFVNAGQTCVAPDYALVHTSKVQDFLARVKTKITAFYGESEEARQQSVDFARMVDERAFQRVKTLVDSSVARGAKVEVGGRYDEGTRYIAPTVLSNVTPDAPIMGEEIFGPVLPVLTWSSREELYRHIDAGGKPLALYVFSRDERMIEEVLRNTTAGGSVVNHTLIHLANPNLPFGGVGASGQGSYHGFSGFRTFSHERAVLVQGRLDMLRMLFPPYGRKAQERIMTVVRKLNG